MGNKLKKAQKKLQARQQNYDNNLQSNPAFKRAGSLNIKKQNTAGTTSGRK